MHELRRQWDMPVRDTERSLENHQEKLMMRFESMFGEVCAQFKKAELAVDTLTTKPNNKRIKLPHLKSA